MGSGRGKHRRARSATPATAWRKGPLRVYYDYGSWREFLERVGIQDQKLHSYYLGKKRSSGIGEMHDKNEFVVQSLFNDAVKVGAIILPKPYIAEDFAFRIRENLVVCI